MNIMHNIIMLNVLLENMNETKHIYHIAVEEPETWDELSCEYDNWLCELIHTIANRYDRAEHYTDMTITMYDVCDNEVLTAELFKGYIER